MKQHHLRGVLFFILQYFTASFFYNLLVIRLGLFINYLQYVKC